MALQEKKTPKVTIGPVMESDGLPPNPADTLRDGPLSQRTFPTMTGRRDFTIPTKATLHRQDGLDGAAETVTVKERRFGDSSNVPYPGTQEQDVDDFGEFGANPGSDKNRYSSGQNDAYTKEGQLIRGT